MIETWIINSNDQFYDKFDWASIKQRMISII